VSARVRLCTGVDTNVPLHLKAALEQLSAVGTLERPAVAVHVLRVTLQAAVLAEGSLAQRTLVRSVAGVDAHHVSAEVSALTECFVTQVALVHFLAAPGSAALNSVSRRVDPLVNFHVGVVPETFSTLSARVLTAVDIHMPPPVTLISKLLITLGAII